MRGNPVNGPPKEQTQPSEQDVKASFRESLDDTIAILESVGPLCSDIDELIGILQLAQKNDSQLVLVMDRVAPKRMRGR